MLRREVVERQQLLAVFVQTQGRLGVLMKTLLHDALIREAQESTRCTFPRNEQSKALPLPPWLADNPILIHMQDVELAITMSLAEGGTKLPDNVPH